MKVGDVQILRRLDVSSKNKQTDRYFETFLALQNIETRERAL